jgi:uncharacterized protein (TIGR02246 family)
MYRRISMTALLFSGLCALGHADDRSDIEAIVKEYSRLEASGDVTTQANLMTADRLWTAGGQRRTDQSLNMQIQQAGMDRRNARYPNAKVFYDARDVIVRVYGGDAAVASFYWYTNVVLSADSDEPNPHIAPTIVTMFLTKQGGVWKIAASHASLLNPSN